MLISRRRLFTLAAPAIVCAANIMPVKAWRGAAPWALSSTEVREILAEHGQVTSATFDIHRWVWTFEPGSLAVTMEEMVDRAYLRPQLQLRS
ncbi:MAG TPA: hypothetical protein VD994_13765 [Prosthecobacter sp.]|nr:hypothetical protein [Prosthecobacter sp.]